MVAARGGPPIDEHGARSSAADRSSTAQSTDGPSRADVDREIALAFRRDVKG